MAKNQVITLGEGLVCLNHARLTCSLLSMPYTEANAATTPPQKLLADKVNVCADNNNRLYAQSLNMRSAGKGLRPTSWIGESDRRQG